jgi:hypothetical protein
MKLPRTQVPGSYREAPPPPKCSEGNPPLSNIQQVRITARQVRLAGVFRSVPIVGCQSIRLSTDHSGESVSAHAEARLFEHGLGAARACAAGRELLVRSVVDPGVEVRVDMLLAGRDCLKALARFFGGITADTDPKFDGVDVDYDAIESGSSLVYDHLVLKFVAHDDRPPPLQLLADCGRRAQLYGAREEVVVKESPGDVEELRLSAAGQGGFSEVDHSAPPANETPREGMECRDLDTA